MILVELLIDNYKQYVREQRIAFPTEGIVGVIGANGVGKTTLFEAIEWCLYQPRQILNSDVAPRGGLAQTRVRLVLEDPRDNTRYVVERTLKRERADGEIYREDQPDARITHGPKQVTDYVTRHLIGLGHDAFVSTFFTHQKELSFFGNLRETDRRREVGRLLGLETIRSAQELIREDRNRARAEATNLANQYADLSANRDFAAELAAAETGIAAQQTAAAAAAERLDAATEAHTLARAELERCRDLERRDATLAQTLERVAGDERAAAARRDAAADALRRLDELAATRETLTPEADLEPERAEAVRILVAEQERANRQRQHQTELARAERARADAARDIHGTIEGVGADGRRIEGWAWRSADDADPVAAAERRVALVAGLDIDAACERAVQLVECQTLAADRDAARAKATRYADHLRGLQAERTTLVAAGNPHDIVDGARGARERDLRAAQAAETEAKGSTLERQRLVPIASALRAQRFEDECPTCGRSFSEHEAGLVLTTLDDRIATLTAEETTLLASRTAALKSAQAHEAVQLASMQRGQDLAALDGRIADGVPKVEEADAEAHDKTRACNDALARAGLDGDPAPERVKQAEAHAKLLQRLAGTVGVLQQSAVAARRAATEADDARRAVADLGTVAYDPAVHTAAEQALAAARAAASRIAQIDDDLARRPEHEAERAAAIAALDALAAEGTRLYADRAAVGFDRAALDAADEREKATHTAERASVNERNEALNAFHAATGHRAEVVKEHARVAKLAQRADARRRDADELNRMDEGFTAFDKYVAARVTPALADHTSELLAAMTEGKYDRAEFDENYGLRVFDNDERFPVDAFSGGERDIAALAARLALSRFVGGQAAHPPAFLVLDEVFGSLDQDRRTKTLETLGALHASTDAFRQLFIISHIDDVRNSPVFDEVWRIAEVNGVSHVENVSRDGALEEL